MNQAKTPLSQPASLAIHTSEPSGQTDSLLTVAEAQPLLAELAAALGNVIRGKSDEIAQLLCALLSGGHLLIDDVPGVGKTTLAKALAACLQIDMRRVQFTPDLLPADILGSQVLDTTAGGFSFHRGPVFTQLLLADEINRASPRTQSALLEAMSEEQVTIDGHSFPLQKPFMVIATQNPVESHGTYPLPEAQLDRFTARLTLGYPSAEDELTLLLEQQVNAPLTQVSAVMDSATLLALQHLTRTINISDPVARYLIALTQASRKHPAVSLGVSPRGTQMLLRCTQAQALMEGRDYVLPDDIQRVAVPVVAHRLLLQGDARYGGVTAQAVVRELIEQTEVPC